MKNYILVIDEGTTGVRALIFDRNMQILSQSYEKLETYIPEPGSLELDAEEIYEKTVKVCRDVVAKQGISPEEIECVGLTSQRASWLFWDKTTGKPLRNVVTWMDTRGIHQKPKFMADPKFNEMFPGLAPYLPGLWMPLIFDKIRDEDKEFAERVMGENILFGHVESYLVWKLTKGAVHATNFSSASMSGIYLADYKIWNIPVLVQYLGLRPDMLPEIREESADYGMLDADILGIEIPINSSFADQQSALFAQNCLEDNSVKCTMGTGAFFDINIGDEHRKVLGLNDGVCWCMNGQTKYLLEGMSTTAGACLEWAKNQFKLFDDFGEMEIMAGQVESSEGVYFVPALQGINGDDTAKAAYMGIRPNITNNHMMRATLEGIAYGSLSLIDRAFAEGAEGVQKIYISGGVAKSDIIAQIMADVTGAQIIRTKSVEATALGAVEMAAIRAGWMTVDDVAKYVDVERTFEPGDKAEEQKLNYQNWKKVVERTMKWEM